MYIQFDSEFEYQADTCFYSGQIIKKNARHETFTGKPSVIYWNCYRFGSTVINSEDMHIAIAGNIGAGKTTLTQKLASHYGWEPFIETVEHNPYLTDFYEDMHRWAFHLQVYFLSSRFRQVLQINQHPRNLVQDRSIYEDAYIFANNLYTSGLMTARDYGNYLQLFESMIKLVQPPDLLVYLRAGLPKLMMQIGKRGRDYEANISLEYLRNLNQHYESWISNYTLGKLLIIDVNQLDFVNNPQDMNEIIRQIDQSLFASSSFFTGNKD